MKNRLMGLAIAFASVSGCLCGPAPGEFGSSCTTDADCTTGACYTGYSGGYCSSRCEDAACPEGARCAALATGSYCLQNCLFGAIDCRDGYYCADVSAGAICRPKCTNAAECGAGATCSDEGECVAGTPGVIGAECTVNVGCQSGRCEVALPSGVCTQPCAQSSNGAGAFDVDCPAGSECTQVSEAGGFCYASCANDAACRSGFFCDKGSCRPKCRGAADCALGYTCNKGSGLCIEGSAAPRQTGATCNVDGDCDSNYCLDEPNQQFPGGVCSAACTNNSAVCGSSAICIVSADPMFDSVCLQKCSTNFDCRADYFCSDVTNSTEKICLPRCTAVSLCTAPEVCDTYSGDCAVPQPNATTNIDRVPLGTMAMGSSQTQKEFTLNVPQGAVSFTLVLKGGVGGISVVYRLTGPDGDVLFDFDNYLTSKVRILPVNDGDFGMLFPNTPRVSIQPGNYKITVVNEGGSGTGEVFALVKRATTSNLSGGKLKLNFWFAGVSGLNAANAASHAKLQEAIAEFRRIYATVGIDVSQAQVAYFDVPNASTYATIDSTDGKDSELRRLFELSKGSNNNGMNFFLVNEISGGDPGFIILGIAGGIPGIPFEQGTNASGVAVTAKDLSADPKAVARTMAHEGGHWLGLWHTTEADGKLTDPLSDTPECPVSRDSNSDKKLTSSECVGFGADHLMFWQAGPTAEKVSGNQGFVLQRNPVVSN